MKHKTSELTGALLDWCVAIANGHATYDIQDGRCTSGKLGGGDDVVFFGPSTNWAHGGPIIEREQISVMNPSPNTRGWFACTTFYFDGGMDGATGEGHTALIAAMRAFVASKIGDEVDLPGT